MARSIFLPGESISDVQDSLNKAQSEDELKHLISERLKKNGWSREKEESFRNCCKAIGFILPFQREKGNPLASDTKGRASARLLAEAASHERHHSHLIKDNMEGT